MYIKQIIIQGFKSYKDQTVIEPFSPKTNVIVGRNGSGKSNFFAAIRFVLSDAYTQMGREERQGLLHEGSGSAVMQAYVEIIFDNSDDRFPTGGKEVTLRRSIGLKKDEYSVDKKVVTKSDVMNLLEAAGFSRSNPYYIVPQGRVTALTNMKESDRLNLLKEVAGTQVYEARRAESLKIMNETTNKREKIDELLEYIKERLAELEEEKEELRGFQDKDRERRCLEYAYHHQEQVSVQSALDEIDGARQDGLDNADSSRTEFLEAEKRIEKLQAQIHQLGRDMELLQIERRQLDEDRRDSAKTLAQAELKTRNLQDGQSSQEQAQAQHAAELQAVQADIAQKQAELAAIMPNFNQQQEQEYSIDKQLREAESARDLLVAKQGRGSQHKSKAERDAWLKGEIEELRSNLGTQNGNMMDAKADIERLEGSIAQGDATLAGYRANLQNWSNNRGQIQDDIAAALERRNDLNEERKLIRREEDKLNQIISNARQEKAAADDAVSQVIAPDIAKGLASIRRLKEDPRHNLTGVYGTVAELLQVNDAYRLPVEQIAGTSLFHYVVDNADTATYLMDYLAKNHAGRVTFAPLSQLRTRSKFNFPNSKDAVPLISKLTYDPQFEAAFQHVFGKAVVCPNLGVASQFARSHGVDAITVDGDTANKRGAMTGGYLDRNKSRLMAVEAANKWRRELDQLNEQSRNLRHQLEVKDQEITGAMSELQKIEAKLRQTDAGLGPLKGDVQNLSAHLDFQRQQLDDAMKRRDVTQQNISSFLQVVSAHESELGTEFKNSLSAADEQLLEQHRFLAENLRRQYLGVSNTRRELQRKKQYLETELRQNLQMKLDQLNSQAFEFSASGGKSGSLAEAQKELKKAQKALKSAETNLQETEARMDKLTAQRDTKSTEKFELEQAQLELSAKIEKQQKRMDKTLQRKALLTSQAAECAKNIRDLGALPEEAFDKYENMQTNTIATKLKKVNEALKKYKHVNKKAFEQYNNFTMQQDQLMKRRQELDASQGSIEELVEHLDRRKDEAIERTFKQVSKEFTTIFEKLVPAGQGRLVIQRRTDPRQNDDESDEEARGSVENYIGVGISVSFNSKHHDEQQRIQQLSGGQKSLCALCLIFALQQTESSPMVIFDEVDANLDAQYRTAVAALLESISNEAGTQFICTTFRPEIVHTADKCYGVTFHNKTSSVDCVPMEEALNFIEGQAKPQ